MTGKGKGVIAKIDILASTLILSEVPIFTVPQDVHESVLEVITIVKESFKKKSSLYVVGGLLGKCCYKSCRGEKTILPVLS